MGNLARILLFAPLAGTAIAAEQRLAPIWPLPFPRDRCRRFLGSAGHAMATGSGQKGFTVFFTGLPCAGKSTVAKALVARLEHIGLTVSLLDGDVVRRRLTPELGFSKEHRDRNVERVGFVASEITRCGGAVVCALIAPYDEARRSVRRMIESVGGFYLVSLSTPLDACEARDLKGLYGKARAGVLAQFTGVSDPYEVPADAELMIDTARLLSTRRSTGC